MNTEKALFILRHGSYEGHQKYLEAVKVIEDELDRKNETIEQIKTALFKCGEEAVEIANYKKIAEHQQSISMDRFFEIQRLKAELERLKAEKDNLIRTYAECQTEAVKEFAERLKTNVFEVDDINEDTFLAVEVSYIDYLVGEFTEGG